MMGQLVNVARRKIRRFLLRELMMGLLVNGHGGKLAGSCSVKAHSMDCINIIAKKCMPYNKKRRE